MKTIIAIISILLMIPNLYGDTFKIHVPIDIDNIPTFRLSGNDKYTVDSIGIYYEISNCTSDPNFVITGKKFFYRTSYPGIHQTINFEVDSDVTCTTNNIYVHVKPKFEARRFWWITPRKIATESSIKDLVDVYNDSVTATLRKVEITTTNN